MGKVRDPWLDNHKTLLIVLVVIGHSLVLLPTSDLRNQAYDTIYYFHMPAFVLVSGYLSRSFRWTGRHLGALVTTLVVPYFVFSWLMAMWRIHVTHEVTSLDPIWTDPHWPMWYLAAMVMWRLVTPILRLHPLMILVAVGISLWGGTVDQEFFDLNRTMGFLPFFAVGLHVPDRLLALLRSGWAILPGLAYFAWLWWWLAPRTDDLWSTPWLFFRSPYADLGAGTAEGMQIRAWLILIAVGGAMAALAVTPRRHTLLSAMGAYTLVVYLFHGFLIRYADQAEWADLLPQRAEWAVPLIVVLAIAWALLLGWPPVARRLLWLIDPWGAWQARRVGANSTRNPARSA